jgi:hypothetical protein
MEALLEEFQGIKVEGFIVWRKFQDLILHVAHITIRLDIKSMNVHLLKIMWGKDLSSISKIYIQNLRKWKTMDILS